MAEGGQMEFEEFIMPLEVEALIENACQEPEIPNESVTEVTETTVEVEPVPVTYEYKDLCIICGKHRTFTRHYSKIESTVGKRKQLSSILKQFFGISADKGVMCKHCVGMILTVEKKVNQVQHNYKCTSMKYNKTSSTEDSEVFMCKPPSQDSDWYKRMADRDIPNHKSHHYELQGIEIKSKNNVDTAVVLKLPKTANIVGRFLVTYENELNINCTETDYTTLWALLENLKNYKPAQRTDPKMMYDQTNNISVPSTPNNKPASTRSSILSQTAAKRKMNPETSVVPAVSQPKQRRTESLDAVLESINQQEAAKTLNQGDSEMVSSLDSLIDQDVDDVGDAGIGDDDDGGVVDNPDAWLTEMQQKEDGDVVTEEAETPVLSEHSYSWMKKEVSLCSKCGEPLPPGEEDKHTETCKGIKIMCGACKWLFTSLRDIELHLTNVHGAKSEFFCKKCKKAFADEKRFCMHEKEHHKTNFNLKCKACSRFFESWEELDQHDKECRIKRMYECAQCNDVFVYESTIKNHMFNTDHNQGFICRVCDEKFDDLNVYLEHTRAEKGKNAKENICHICGKKFAKKFLLRKHVKCTHNTSRMMCDICGWSTHRKDSFVIHMAMHRTGGYKCDMCNFTFICRDKMIIHRAMHSARVCTQCNFVFLGSASMRRHMKSLHGTDVDEEETNRVTNYNQTLNLTTESTNQLTQIMSQAAGDTAENSTGNVDQTAKSSGKDKTFLICSGCNAKLPNAAAARRHLVRKDSCFKCHMCQFCGIIFPTTEELCRHEESHTGPYLCYYCNRGFLEWEKCSTHMSTHVLVREDNQYEKKEKKEKKDMSDKPKSKRGRKKKIVVEQAAQNEEVAHEETVEAVDKIKVS